MATAHDARRDRAAAAPGVPGAGGDVVAPGPAAGRVGGAAQETTVGKVAAPCCPLCGAWLVRALGPAEAL